MRSWYKSIFLKSAQRLVPAIEEADLIPACSGVRAQAVLPTGDLVDDFLFAEDDQSIHVCNAPSPAATASLEIGKSIVDRVEQKIADASDDFYCGQNDRLKPPRE